MKLLQRVALTLSLLFLGTFSFSQSPNKELAPGYYVVVGAYAASRENIAQNYVEVLNRQGHQASYGYNAIKKMYFVYVEEHGDLKSALRGMQKTRRGKFPDAWVRVVPGVVSNTYSETVATPQVTPTESVKPTTPATPVIPDTTALQSTPTSMPESIVSDIPVTDNEEIEQFERMTLGNTEVFLSLFDARNHRIVSGEVQVVDTERAKGLTKVKGNEYLLLPDPKSKSGQLTLICEAFGYRKVQQEINYPLPLADTVKPFIDLMGTTLVINFDLVRYHKGDIATLYNVYFYNDAALMLPESKFELNSLLNLMQEGSYKIRLHGHTNGNYQGRIITMGDNKDLFSLEGSKNTVGTAKDLSRLRAEIIKEFLVGSGIAADRIEIKAWGGKKPLFDRNSVNAKRNVRVEVEILSE
jgi:outer membrane protein OmpA-like peptidoglycan-associated protein